MQPAEKMAWGVNRIFLLRRWVLVWLSQVELLKFDSSWISCILVFHMVKPDVVAEILDRSEKISAKRLEGLGCRPSAFCAATLKSCVQNVTPWGCSAWPHERQSCSGLATERGFLFEALTTQKCESGERKWSSSPKTLLWGSRHLQTINFRPVSWNKEFPVEILRLVLPSRKVCIHFSYNGWSHPKSLMNL